MLAKSHDILTKKPPSVKVCNNLRDHFSQHFNHADDSNPDVLNKLPPSINQQTFTGKTYNVLCDPPTLDELRKIVARMRNGKSTLDLPKELLLETFQNDTRSSFLLNIASNIWQDHKVPASMKYVSIMPLWKSKGKRTCPENYRGISVQSILIKMIKSYVLEKVK